MRLRVALKIAQSGRDQSRWRAAIRVLNRRGYVAYARGMNGFAIFDKVGGRIMFGGD